ncbi:MAG: diacylglycerol kinase family protein [Bacilli bacterium]
MIYLLVNPLANNSTANEVMHNVLDSVHSTFGKETETKDITKLEYDFFLNSLKENDVVVLFGGDGTFSYLGNALCGKKLPCDFFVYGAGTGNDFLRDVNTQKINFFRINDYLINLPRVIVNGETKRFLNNVGFGIDGEVCVVADQQKKNGKEKINYTSLAISLLLFKYKPCDCKVTVDGVEHDFKHCWLAPTMNGRYYGGGMMACPKQNCLSDKVSIMLMCGKGKIATLLCFKDIFAGTHVKNKRTTILEGKSIKVEFASPRALQIDGEVIENISSYEITK